jgi:hypothetical protein
MADYSLAIPAVMNSTPYENKWTDPPNQNLAEHVRTD